MLNRVTDMGCDIINNLMSVKYVYYSNKLHFNYTTRIGRIMKTSKLFFDLIFTVHMNYELMKSQFNVSFRGEYDMRSSIFIDIKTTIYKYNFGIILYYLNSLKFQKRSSYLINIREEIRYSNTIIISLNLPLWVQYIF